MKNDTKNFIIALIGVLLLTFGLYFLFAPSRAEAQDPHVSQQEICMDLATGAAVIADYRDGGITSDQFVTQMRQDQSEGTNTAEMTNVAIAIAYLVYSEYSSMAPYQIAVVIYDTCLESEG